MVLKQLLCFITAIAFLGRGAVNGTSIDTTTGADLNKAKIVTSLWNLDANYTETAIGVINFTEGLRLTGTGSTWVGVQLPIEKQLIFRTAYRPKIRLKNALHLGEGTVIYCAQDSEIYSEDGEKYVIYLDGNITVSGYNPGDQAYLYLHDVIVDGMGHSITLGNDQNSGAMMIGPNVTLRNVTLKNVWWDLNGGTFALSGIDLPFDENTLTLENVDFQARRGKAVGLLMQGLFTPYAYRIRGNVRFGNFGEYFLFSSYTGASQFIIEDNATLTIDNSSFYVGPAIMDDMSLIQIIFQSNTSRILLKNSFFGLYPKRMNVVGHWFYPAGSQDLPLTKGTIIAEGDCTLGARTDLQSGNKNATIYIGSPDTSDNDFNIQVNAGSTLNLVSTTTNSLVLFFNVH